MIIRRSKLELTLCFHKGKTTYHFAVLESEKPFFSYLPCKFKSSVLALKIGPFR